MKKIFLLLVIATSLLACSSSDESEPEIGGVIKFKVNGVQKTFDQVEVSENLYFEGTPDEYSELFVYGYSDELPNENVKFVLYKNHLEDIVSVFYYVYGTDYQRKEEGFTMNITQNGNNNHLKGTFTGLMVPYNQPEGFINTTNGEFNVQY